jgi:hypothetical protein
MQYIVHILASWMDLAAMSDDRTRVTVRLPDDAYEELCGELPSFSADTSRFQFLVQFYLDYKQLEQVPSCQCTPATDGGAPARNEANEATATSGSADSPPSRSEPSRHPSQKSEQHRSANEAGHGQKPNQQTETDS